VSETGRAWTFDGSRWSVLAVLALVGAVVSGIGGTWLEAALFVAAAVVLAVVALRTGRR
jgi:apolipoprotein N-acyltransferase